MMNGAVYFLALIFVGSVDNSSAGAGSQDHVAKIVDCISPSRIDSWALKAKAFRLGEGKEGPELAAAEAMGKELFHEAQAIGMCLNSHRRQAIKAMGCDDTPLNLFNVFEEAAREYSRRAMPYGRSHYTYLTEMQEAAVAYTVARDNLLSYLRNHAPSHASATDLKNAAQYGPSKEGACP